MIFGMQTQQTNFKKNIIQNKLKNYKIKYNNLKKN